MANAVYDYFQVKEKMDIKKAIFWPVLISIIGHAALIMATSVLDLRENVKYTEVYTVSIKEPDQPLPPIPKKEDTPEEKKPIQTKSIKGTAIPGWREDSVDLNSTNPKYSTFLLDMRRRLNGMWTKLDYMKKLSPGAGVVILVVSVNEDGSIYNIDITSSSGPKILEQNAKLIVNSVARFSQLTDGLSRLHVTVRIPFSE
jgi:TonB family protein